MKTFIKKISRRRQSGYRTPNRFRRSLKYKFQQLKKWARRGQAAGKTTEIPDG